MLSSVVEHRIADPAVTGSNPVVSWFFLVGVVGNISACHADARGSIPRLGVFLLSFQCNKLVTLCKRKKATNGIRTHDLSLTKRVLYQLSYSGDNCKELLEIGLKLLFDIPVEFSLQKDFQPAVSVRKKTLTGRIRTIDLGITIVNFYSPPLYQLSYGESYVCLVCYDLVIT